LVEKFVVACPPETEPVDFGAAVHAEAMRRGLGRAKTVYVVIDGAVWLWHVAQDRFATAVKTLDFQHASEHLRAVGQALHGEGSEASRAWGLDIPAGPVGPIPKWRSNSPVELKLTNNPQKRPFFSGLFRHRGHGNHLGLARVIIGPAELHQCRRSQSETSGSGSTDAGVDLLIVWRSGWSTPIRCRFTVWRVVRAPTRPGCARRRELCRNRSELSMYSKQGHKLGESIQQTATGNPFAFSTLHTMS
jgi:hypothetical protein